jgi:chromosome segregation protein
MYFKQVELFGFKSFADRTQVDLEPGITAIVGPNGCGKSNILDALRWSLGEQSAKALRGSHMQDVIFNGSEQRSPMGMSEVTLTFDNADSRLPLDFAEVQITRRVYRSGESEYLINKAPCRLKDIQELFMDTGIGTNAYSLIGQGKIDLVLSSKPDDRRYLFEEAAGIIKYKSRKKIAMRKLDSADQNLLRLTDIIGEVQRQMRSLKRQVNAAIRHRELTEALRDLEVRNAWLQFNELSGQIEDLKIRYTAAAENFETATTKTSQLDARAEEMNLKRIELDRVLMARRDGEYQVDSEMEKLESQVALLQKEIDFSQKNRAQALREQEEFQARAAAIQQTQSDIGEQSSTLGLEIEAAHQAMTDKQTEYNAAQEAVRLADEAVENQRNRTLETLNSRNKAQTELETLSVSLLNIDQQLEGIFDNQEGQNTRHEELSQQLQEIQKTESEQQRLLTEAVDHRRNVLEQQQTQTGRMEKLNTEWQTLREKKSSDEARLNSLRELRDSYEGFATGVKAVMRAKNENFPECQGLIGPVGDLLSSEKKYGRALEAGLGGNINNVIVEEADNAKSAISFLKKHRAGRVTFLPLDTIRGSSRDDFDVLKGLPGVIGRAITFAQCDQRIMPAVEYLLFNTVFVETIDDAIRIARSERRFPRLVTLDGEVVSSAGAVTGGRTKHESSGLLGRSAEIEELEGAVEKATTRIQTIAAEGQELTLTIQNFKNEIQQLEETENSSRKALNDAGVIVARLSTELEGLTNTSDRLGQQRDKLLTDREDLEKRRETAQGKINSIEGDDETLQGQVADFQTAAVEARQALSRHGDELADLRVRLAELTQSVEEVERNKLREQREYTQALEEAERRLKLADEMQAQEKTLEDSIADALERAKALSETRGEAHDKVLESQKELEALIEESNRVAESLKALRLQGATAQKEVHTLELDLTHKEDRVEFFQERILTEYSLALASLSEKDVGTDEHDEEEREKLIEQHRKGLQRLGTVNLMAIEEYETLEERETFLLHQESDLRKAHETLMSVVARIDVTIREMFLDTFNTVSEYFKAYFRRLFNGGQARIYLLDEDDPLESGIEIEARPPGKKPQTISLLSGGEQAMTAIALLFSIFNAKPSPFCVLDEVDAPLDDANIGKFLGLVDEFTDKSQFIIITHSKQTMAHADALFGVTQQERGVSQLVSVRIDEVDDTEAA